MTFMTELTDANTVADFLQKHPEFFEHRPELLASLRLTTSLGGRTVSLQERQVEVLRDKIRQFELKLATLTRNATSNEVVMGNFHQWVLRLLATTESENAPDTLLRTLKECFNVPAAALRLWQVKPEYANAWYAADAQEASVFTERQSVPLCGPAADKPGVPWLDNATLMQSAALVPLRKRDSQQIFGLLVMGSPDPQRFSAELATDVLVRIGEIASARLQELTA
jgi:uncharacterized protein YigA (DUF484 family)